MPRPPAASYKSKDRGPIEFESRLHEEKGKIMELAREDVITIPQSLPIKDTSERMVENDVRRIPVTSPGTGKLLGMIVTRDIVDFLGGGEKHQIIQKKHAGNFLSAINDHSKTIMNPDAPFTKDSSSISEVAKLLLETGVGGVPILNKKETVVGIVTERDFAKYMPSPANVRVEGHMTKDVVTADPDIPLIDAMKRMISEGFRRLPVVKNGSLTGVITSVDVLEYFGTNEVFNHMQSGDALDAMSIEIKKLMTRDPVTTTPEADLGRVARKMGNHGYGGLPVLENDELIGMITERDILDLLL